MKLDLEQFLQPHLAYLAILSMLICGALIVLARFLPRLGGRHDDMNAVQAMHDGLIPRVGGIAIFGALAFSVLFAPDITSQSYFQFLVATSLLFVVGLREDLGFHVSPRLRLVAVVATSLIVVVLLEVWLPRIGAPFVDQLLQYWFIGVPFTLLITAGVSNGFNLIDGVNGLASMTAMTASVAIALIALQGGYTAMVTLSMMLAAVTLGFFIVNFPFGLIFLGDAGAYTLGFVLCWFGIAVILNVPVVSPWAILLTLFWPLADTLLAMYRRRRGNKDPMMPDRLHAHQLVMRTIEICFIGRGYRNITNPLTTLVLAPFVVTPQIVAVLLWDNNLAAFLAVLLFLALFFGSFAFVLSAASNYRLRMDVV
ncbi:MAG: MraY family glycosyltransferase [Yoonia sp.]